MLETPLAYLNATAGGSGPKAVVTSLAAGQDYVLEGSGAGTGTVFDPQGRAVATLNVYLAEWQSDSVPFRATYAAAYTLRAEPMAPNFTVYAGLYRDCGGDIKSLCRLGLNAQQAGIIGGRADRD